MFKLCIVEVSLCKGLGEFGKIRWVDFSFEVIWLDEFGGESTVEGF